MDKHDNRTPIKKGYQPGEEDQNTKTGPLGYKPGKEGRLDDEGNPPSGGSNVNQQKKPI